MSVKKSTIITNADATTSTFNDVANSKGRIQVSMGTIALATSDIDNADIIKLCRLPKNARVTGIWICNDDLDSNGTPLLAFHVGLYPFNSDTAADNDCYAASQTTLQAATTTWTDVYKIGQELRGQAVWQDAGAATEAAAATSYDVCLTISAGAGTAAAGDVAFKVEYVTPGD